MASRGSSRQVQCRLHWDLVLSSVHTPYRKYRRPMCCIPPRKELIQKMVLGRMVKWVGYQKIILYLRRAPATAPTTLSPGIGFRGAKMSSTPSDSHIPVRQPHFPLSVTSDGNWSDLTCFTGAWRLARITNPFAKRYSISHPTQPIRLVRTVVLNHLILIAHIYFQICISIR